jgi:hypothetical protein
VACRIGYRRAVRPERASPQCRGGGEYGPRLIVPPLALLLLGSAVCFYNYFVLWARTIDSSDDHAHVVAGYLDHQEGQLILTPNRFFADGATNFLLQARYPNLLSIDSEGLRALLTSHRGEQPGQDGAVYLMPHGETSQSAWTLLAPSSGTSAGTAYLLPYFTRAQTKAMAEQTQALTPTLTIADRRYEVIADVYPLEADAPFLPRDSEPMHPLHASFGGDVLLDGYYVAPSAIKPGQEVGLSLSWQAQRFIDGGYDLFIHVFNIQTGQRYGQVNTSLGSSVLLHSHWWPTGLRVVDTHYFVLPQDVPEGAYRFEIGLYYRSSLERLPVTMGKDTQATDDKVVLGKFLVQRLPLPLPQHRLQAQFGDRIALIGFDISAPIVEAGQSRARVTLYWQALTPISTDYTVFVHLLDGQGNLRSQHDSMPQQGRYPTSLWSTGETVPDVHDLALRADMPPGDYTVRVGLYDLQTGQRLPLKNQAGDYVDLPISMHGNDSR